jgi:hypothetical protein
MNQGWEDGFGFGCRTLVVFGCLGLGLSDKRRMKGYKFIPVAGDDIEDSTMEFSKEDDVDGVRYRYVI